MRITRTYIAITEGGYRFPSDAPEGSTVRIWPDGHAAPVSVILTGDHYEPGVLIAERHPADYL
ncbi:hypothetical protein ACWDCO_17395 [Streptomyces albogriseolus]